MNPFARNGVALAVLAVLCVPVWVDSASGAKRAGATECTLGGVTLQLEPGLSTKTGPGKFKQINEGTIACDGPVLGQKVTGPGKWLAIFGSYTGACSGGNGAFTARFAFPTAHGTLAWTNKGTITFGPLKHGAIGGDFDGDKMAGSFTVVPKKGDCLIRPLTEMALDAHGTLK